MTKTLEEIRKKLQALDSRKGQGNGSNDKTIYPHWNIPEGTSTTVRFLPDGNTDNALFWIERQLLKFSFPGIKGQEENKQVTVQVPCIEMWNGKNTCPVLNEVRPWWNDESLKTMAGKYWCKRTYFMQGFVKQDPMRETDPPENPIRKFIIGPQIFAIIKAALLDPDMTTNPVDYINGVDFIINKTSKGGYADYGTSKWARKETSVSEEMMEAINQFGLVDLSTYLPKKPSDEQLAAIYEMFQASVEGELYDPSRWSQFYKPFGFDSHQDEDGGEAKSAKPVIRSPIVTPQPKIQSPVKEQIEEVAEHVSVSEKTEVKAEVKSETTVAKTPQEILAMIRSRNNK